MARMILQMSLAVKGMLGISFCVDYAKLKGTEGVGYRVGIESMVLKYNTEECSILLQIFASRVVRRGTDRGLRKGTEQELWEFTNRQP